MMSDNGSLDSHDNDGSILINSVIKESENPNVDILEDLDSYLEVSRFVSDSVTRGMQNAVETEARKILSSEENEISRSRLILDQACNDEYKERLWEQNVESCGKKSLLLDPKIKEIAGLRRELELMSKLLSGYANEDIDEALESQKNADQLRRKISGSLVSTSSIWDENGKHIECLRHLSHEQLINHFKNEMNQMKREHDYTIQEMTEEYFSIKRRCLNLKNRGSFSCLKKDKEFDVLRKKIPDIILKLDKVLLEDEKSVFEGMNNADFKSQVDSLLLENCQLKDSLSEADQKISQLSQFEANHRKLIRKLESDVEDSHVEASIFEDVYGSFVGEFVNQIHCAKKETDLEHCIMREAYELISRDLGNREASERKIDLEDSCVESYVTEECCALISKESLKEADKKLGKLNKNALGKEQALRSEMVKKERLKEEIYWLDSLVKEKENLVQIAENDLATEKEKLEIVFQQINTLQFQVDQQAVVIQNKNKELKVVSARAAEKTEGYEMELSELRQKLELARKNMKITENEKVKSELKLSSTEAEQKRLKNQFVSTVLLSLAKWSQGFDNLECVLAEKMTKTNSRLESMQSQLSDLLDEVDELKARESMYKQQMEKKTCDLHKAETEVDLLGDEIESFLELLAKIYLGLDHYSLILKHYPGIIEILTLVRRELRGESKRLSVFRPSFI